MAIGKVGSFATVEPALVDFGSMVERNIDKIKADEAAKAAAKAAVEKAKSDALKDVKDVDAFKLSGVTGYDQTLSGTVNGMYQKFLDAKEAYLSTGDRSYLLVADKIRNEVATINNESEAMAGVLTKFAELSKTGKINSEIADEKLLELQAIKDEKVKYSFEDGKTMMTFTDEDGNITNKVPASGYVTNMLGDMPESFKLNDEIKGIVETVKASEIEAGGASYRKTVTDINSPDSEPQRKRLDNAAKYFSEQNNSMASWYQSKRKEEKAKGNVLPLKTSGWTEDEKAEAKKFFYDQMINSYQKKVSIDAKEPSGGSGGKDDDSISISSEVGSRYTVTRKDGKELSKVGAGYAVALGGKPEEYKDRKREVIEMGFDEKKKSFYVKYKDFFGASDDRAKKDGVVGYFYSDGQKTDVDKIVGKVINPNTGLPFEGAKDADNYIKSLPGYQDYLKGTKGGATVDLNASNRVKK